MRVSRRKSARGQVHYHGANTAEVGVHTVRLPKESTAADVCEELLRQLPEAGRPARLRLLEVFYSKIFKARLTGVRSFACRSLQGKQSE